MSRKKKPNTTIGSIDEYIKANRKASREIELEQHVGWVSVNRPHKNKKKYNRKDEKIKNRRNLDGFSYYKQFYINRLEVLYI